MITVNIKDGLGNQMFQYATGYALAKRLNSQLICDTRVLNEFWQNPPPNYVKRKFSLDIFGIKPSKLNIIDLMLTLQFNKRYAVRFNISKLLDRISPFNYLERSRKTENRLLKTSCKILYLDGYWQNEIYFKDYRNQILDLYSFTDLENETKNIKFQQQIDYSKDVCLNVRRTDHLNSKELNVINYNYYKNCINFFLEKFEKTRFFIFSDDIEWCRKNFKDMTKFIIVDHNFAGYKFKNYLYLMSNFKNFILPNSTFAWWAAWLSKHKDKKVLVPKRWSGINSSDQIDTVLKDWIKINNI